MDHDALLFRRAYPRSSREATRAEGALEAIHRRDQLLDPEVSGIAGTSVDMVVSYEMARWLIERCPGTAAIDWDDPPDDDRLAIALTPAVRMLQERIVDANVPILDFARTKTLEWYVAHVDPAAYDALRLWVRWRIPPEFSRTRMRRNPRRLFYDSKIVPRREVSIERELAGPPLTVAELSRAEGQRALDMARAAVLTRYRELYGFTWGDPSTVISADAGRGLEILLFGLLPEHRLPLRAGFAPFVLRNGVPIGYGDAFGLCERMEVSFNIFYAFREGESAYAFVRLLKLYHQLFGSTVFSIDPYQIGLGNDEAIDAGAFWFYRKLGFRPTDPRIERIARREEAHMAGRPRHRSSAATLRALAEGPLIFEMHPTGEWDRFDLNRALRVSVPPEIARAKRGRTERHYLQLLSADATLRRKLLGRVSFRA